MRARLALCALLALAGCHDWDSLSSGPASDDGGVPDLTAGGSPDSSPAIDLAGVDLAGCHDNQRDGDETDVDCGGGLCGPCALDRVCAADRDCTSGDCHAGHCAQPTCFDNRANGGESDVDCGGPCPRCLNNHPCNAATDCTSGSCVNQTCATAAPATLSFPAASSYVVGTSAWSAVAGRFAGNPRDDLAVTDGTGNAIAIFLSDGSGQLTRAASISGNGLSTPGPLAAGDLDRDGRLDLVVGQNGNNTVAVFRGDGKGGFAFWSAQTAPHPPVDLVLADFDGNGRIDVAVANISLGVGLLLGSGDGMLGATKSYGGPTFELIAGDFDGDGRSDVMEDLAGNLGLLFADGNGVLGNLNSYPAGTNPVGRAITDANNDRKLDVVVADNDLPQVSALAGNGTAVATLGGPFMTTLADKGSCVAAADFDGDGKADLAVVYKTSTKISILRGKGDLSFATPVDFETNKQHDFTSLAIGDFNGDGKPDIAVTNLQDTGVTVLINESK